MAQGNPEEDYGMLQGLAERLGLDETQGEKFINSSMQRLGYKPKVQWGAPEDDGGGDDGDFFSGGGKRERRTVRDQRGGGGGNSGGAGWQYD